jgi:hypothetical protein
MLLSQSNAICLMKNKLNCNEINTGYGKERVSLGLMILYGSAMASKLLC